MLDVDFGKSDSIRFPSKKIFKIFACHGLTSDQDMQRVLEIWVAYPNSQKYFACHGLTSDQDMQRVLEIWVAYPNSQKYFACHGLTSDQDMQRVLGFGVASPKYAKVLCMSRSDLRPGHAKGLRIWGCLP